MAISNDFYINEKKFEEYFDKSQEWLIRSWTLRNEDKEIALLYRKKYKRIAMEHLNKATEEING